MDLETFIADMERRQQLARACNTSPVYLWQIAKGWNGRRAGSELAKAIERESERIGPERVSRASLRPDLWGDEAQGADKDAA